MEEAFGRRKDGGGKVHVAILEGVGHWTVFEDCAGVVNGMKSAGVV